MPSWVIPVAAIVGVIGQLWGGLWIAARAAGVTQEKLARITKTKKSAISRLENHAEDIRLSTVSRVARALGKVVRIELVEAT